MKKRDTVSLIYKNFGYSGSVILVMDLSIQPPHQLPETPPAIIKSAEATEPRDDMVQKFFDSAARAFEEGQLAGKSEDEIIELTAGLVIQILVAQNLRIDDNLMQAFYKQKAAIQSAFPKPMVQNETTPEPVISTFTRVRKRIGKLFNGVLV
jgi:hypothetical protein